MKTNSTILECRAECSFSDPKTGRKFLFAPFSLAAGDLALIDGKSDTDISMLLQILAGHLPTEVLVVPESGGIAAKSVPLDLSNLPIFLCGKGVYQESSPSSHLGVVYSDPDIGIVGRNVLEDYYHALVSVGGRVEEHLATLQLVPFGLSHKLQRPTHVLSDGEKQRLNCATACCGDPPLLICDLSTSNLDQAFIGQLTDWCITMCVEGRCVIMSGVAVETLKDLPPETRLRRLLAARNNNEIGLSEITTGTAQSLNIDEQKRAIAGRLAARTVGDRILVVKGLHRKDITSPVTFEIGAGEIVRVIGSNGSGKTTLGKILVGRFRGREILGEFQFSKEVRPTMSFQFPDRSLLLSTVEEELPESLLRELIGVEHLKKYEPRGLSLSKRKLINIANVLLLAKGLAVLDEPTCGMDWEDKLIFIDLLNSYKDVAIIVITHDRCLDLIGRSVELKEGLQ